jgi:hypothetical protein
MGRKSSKQIALEAAEEQKKKSLEKFTSRHFKGILITSKQKDD